MITFAVRVQEDVERFLALNGDLRAVGENPPRHTRPIRGTAGWNRVIETQARNGEV